MAEEAPSGFKVRKQPPPPSGSWSLYEIHGVHWEPRLLRILIGDDTGEVEVAFQYPASFRSQDEGDMLDVWTAREAEGVEVATIYTIEKSAYLKSLREHAVSGLTLELRHWLVAGLNQCVEVVCDADMVPSISEKRKWADK